MTPQQLQFDRRHIWHPYTSLLDPLPVYSVESANGVCLKLSDGCKLIDGMSSWWAAIHGYNHPVLNAAITTQLQSMAHVMFGGVTHEPAVRLCETLVEITPAPLDRVFLCCSGSAAVEAAMKMALQYCHGVGQSKRNRFLTVRCGYHGDTLNAMSVCDPVSGMHSLYAGVLPENLFAPPPGPPFDAKWNETAIGEFSLLLAENHHQIAAVILEPILQGAGGMRFYSPTYLRRARELCDQFGTLLILDEIATGFGRTGRLFACEHAGIAPDIMCVGKALTGGYMTLGGVLATSRVSDGICSDGGVFMHGPTFMGNPLACSVAEASARLLLDSPWQARVAAIESLLQRGLNVCAGLQHVEDVRVLGAVGVVEMDSPVDVAKAQKLFVERGVWIRPFGKLIYTMPPYTIETHDLEALTSAIVDVVTRLSS